MKPASPSHASTTGELLFYLRPFAAGFLSRLALYAALVVGDVMPLGLGREYVKFFRFDALWHWEIMQHGYGAALRGNGLVSHYSITWPMLMRAVSFLIGEDRLSMMLFNCVVFGFAACAMARLSRTVGMGWWEPVTFLCCFPTAYFSNSIYNEPIFLFLTILSMSAALEGRFLSPAFWGVWGCP